MGYMRDYDGRIIGRKCDCCGGVLYTGGVWGRKQGTDGEELCFDCFQERYPKETFNITGWCPFCRAEDGAPHKKNCIYRL